MNFIGTKELETERLVLKKQTMKEQKRLLEKLPVQFVGFQKMSIKVHR